MRNCYGIWLPDDDTHFVKQLSNGPLIGGKATYQYSKYQAALKQVKRTDHAMDVGAHVGLWSRVMAMDFRKVTAFEPVAAHRGCFLKNIETDNINLLPFAVGASAGKVMVAKPAGNSGNACVSQAGEECEMVALDSLRLAPVDLLKIDVEGYEKEAVLGAEATIRRDKPVMVVEQKPGNAERYGCGRWDAVTLLKDWGMREVAVLSGDHIMVW